MLTLGDILAASRRSAAALDMAELPSDLVDRVATQAAAEAMSAADYVRMAVADFADFAQPEDWTHLLSRLRDQLDAGRVCLLTMVKWRLDAAGAAPPSKTEPTS